MADLQAQRRIWLRENMPRSAMTVEDLAIAAHLTPGQIALLLQDDGAALGPETFRKLAECLDIAPPAELAVIRDQHSLT